MYIKTYTDTTINTDTATNNDNKDLYQCHVITFIGKALEKCIAPILNKHM